MLFSQDVTQTKKEVKAAKNAKPFKNGDLYLTPFNVVVELGEIAFAAVVIGMIKVLPLKSS